jgi:ankyrin repeat protein
MVEHILKTAAGANSLIKAQNKHGRTPMHMAAYLGA